ncbi:hypothetical protein [Allosediminivita pacifica]|uniref:Uncharacterized protein n=1 Tax=Allosediminivita pacifica TaxID=1267769 RepID=A0A2T6ANM9_9RHOB|nr:hypothetical protein [Allosediminivita pacifica]PTX45390.1 hypothetical protein C8N44_12245 [Allosediminivita pacifica]GGB20916.1 hypothetical protein GCM10011324_33700 [Allosediminivita pacifica]
MSEFDWTDAEIAAWCRRIGLPAPDAETAERLRVQAGKVSAAGRTVPRVSEKDLEPATALRVPG